LAKPKTSALIGACRRLANSLKADMTRANVEPTLLGRDREDWARDLLNLANSLTTTIGALGLMSDPNGQRIRMTGAYAKARQKWELLTERKWSEPEDA
jgi:hypothetical protein